jgi:hypothetical protein
LTALGGCGGASAAGALGAQDQGKGHPFQRLFSDGPTTNVLYVNIPQLAGTNQVPPGATRLTSKSGKMSILFLPKTVQEKPVLTKETPIVRTAQPPRADRELMAAQRAAANVLTPARETWFFVGRDRTLDAQRVLTLRGLGPLYGRPTEVKTERQEVVLVKDENSARFIDCVNVPQCDGRCGCRKWARNIPGDVWPMILSYLRPDDCVRFFSVNRSLYSISTNLRVMRLDMTWQCEPMCQFTVWAEPIQYTRTLVSRDYRLHRVPTGTWERKHPPCSKLAKLAFVATVNYKEFSVCQLCRRSHSYFVTLHNRAKVAQSIWHRAQRLAPEIRRCLTYGGLDLKDSGVNAAALLDPGPGPPKKKWVKIDLSKDKPSDPPALQSGASPVPIEERKELPKPLPRSRIPFKRFYFEGDARVVVIRGVEAVHVTPVDELARARYDAFVINTQGALFIDRNERAYTGVRAQFYTVAKAHFQTQSGVNSYMVRFVDWKLYEKPFTPPPKVDCEKPPKPESSDREGRRDRDAREEAEDLFGGNWAVARSNRWQHEAKQGARLGKEKPSPIEAQPLGNIASTALHTGNRFEPLSSRGNKGSKKAATRELDITGALNSLFGDADPPPTLSPLMVEPSEVPLPASDDEGPPTPPSPPPPSPTSLHTPPRSEDERTSSGERDSEDSSSSSNSGSTKSRPSSSGGSSGGRRPRARRTRPPKGAKSPTLDDLIQKKKLEKYMKFQDVWPKTRGRLVESEALEWAAIKTAFWKEGQAIAQEAYRRELLLAYDQCTLGDLTFEALGAAYVENHRRVANDWFEKYLVRARDIAQPSLVWEAERYCKVANEIEAAEEAYKRERLLRAADRLGGMDGRDPLQKLVEETKEDARKWSIKMALRSYLSKQRRARLAENFNPEMFYRMARALAEVQHDENQRGLLAALKGPRPAPDKRVLQETIILPAMMGEKQLRLLAEVEVPPILQAFNEKDEGTWPKLTSSGTRTGTIRPQNGQIAYEYTRWSEKTGHCGMATLALFLDFAEQQGESISTAWFEPKYWKSQNPDDLQKLLEKMVSFSGCCPASFVTLEEGLQRVGPISSAARDTKILSCFLECQIPERGPTNHVAIWLPIWYRPGSRVLGRLDTLIGWWDNAIGVPTIPAPYRFETTDGCRVKPFLGGSCLTLESRLLDRVHFFCEALRPIIVHVSPVQVVNHCRVCYTKDEVGRVAKATRKNMPCCMPRPDLGDCVCIENRHEYDTVVMGRKGARLAKISTVLRKIAHQTPLNEVENTRPGLFDIFYQMKSKLGLILEEESNSALGAEMSYRTALGNDHITLSANPQALERVPYWRIVGGPLGEVETTHILNRPIAGVLKCWCGKEADPTAYKVGVQNWGLCRDCLNYRRCIVCARPCYGHIGCILHGRRKGSQHRQMTEVETRTSKIAHMYLNQLRPGGTAGWFPIAAAMWPPIAAVKSGTVHKDARMGETTAQPPRCCQGVVSLGPVVSGALPIVITPTAAGIHATVTSRAWTAPEATMAPATVASFRGLAKEFIEKLIPRSCIMLPPFSTKAFRRALEEAMQESKFPVEKQKKILRAYNAVKQGGLQKRDYNLSAMMKWEKKDATEMFGVGYIAKSYLLDDDMTGGPFETPLSRHTTGRLIQYYNSNAMSAVFLVITHRLAKWLKKAFPPQSPFCYGGGRDSIGTARAIVEWAQSSAFSCLQEGDFSKFDAHQFGDLLFAEVAIRRSVHDLMFNAADPIVREAIDFMEGKHGGKARVYVRGNGNRTVLKAQVPLFRFSGDPFTTFANSINNLLFNMFAYAVARCRKTGAALNATNLVRVLESREFGVIVAGDDHVRGFRNEEDAVLMNAVLAELNMKMTLGKMIPVSEISRVGFLAGSVCRVMTDYGPDVALIPKLGRWLASLPFRLGTNIADAEWRAAVASGWKNLLGSIPIYSSFVESMASEGVDTKLTPVDLDKDLAWKPHKLTFQRVWATHETVVDLAKQYTNGSVEQLCQTHREVEVILRAAHPLPVMVISPLLERAVANDRA